MSGGGEWREEALARHHDRADFDCGVAALNEYLQRYARQNHETGGAKTFVALPPKTPKIVLGYYTISPGAIAFAKAPATLTRKLGRHVLDEATEPIGVGVRDRSVIDLSLVGFQFTCRNGELERGGALRGGPRKRITSGSAGGDLGVRSCFLSLLTKPSPRSLGEVGPALSFKRFGCPGSSAPVGHVNRRLKPYVARSEPTSPV